MALWEHIQYFQHSVIWWPVHSFSRITAHIIVSLSLFIVLLRPSRYDFDWGWFLSFYRIYKNRYKNMYSKRRKIKGEIKERAITIERKTIERKTGSQWIHKLHSIVEITVTEINWCLKSNFFPVGELEDQLCSYILYYMASSKRQSHLPGQM